MRRRILIIAVAVLVVAGATWGGIAWWHAHQAAERAAADAAAGAEALRDARRDVLTMNTMDYRHMDTCWQAWLGVSTGTLHGQLSQSAAVLTQQFQEQKLITSGTIMKAEVSTADAVAGTATIIGTEDLHITNSGTQAVNHEGFRADLSRTPTGWRLTAFTTDPLNAAG